MFDFGSTDPISLKMRQETVERSKNVTRNGGNFKVFDCATSVMKGGGKRA